MYRFILLNWQLATSWLKITFFEPESFHVCMSEITLAFKLMRSCSAGIAVFTYTRFSELMDEKENIKIGLTT